jgi:KUP system potassium uptake protein
LAIVVGALGVVFGDIGTSPIYTIQTVFNPKDPHPVPISTHSVYGVVSLIFWSVMIIVTLTYVTLVMRADNDGEGRGRGVDVPRWCCRGWASSAPRCSSATA